MTVRCNAMISHTHTHTHTHTHAHAHTHALRYTGWKDQLDSEILREPSVKHHLNQALDMMNRSVAGAYQPGARENVAYLISTERRLAYINYCGA